MAVEAVTALTFARRSAIVSLPFMSRILYCADRTMPRSTLFIKLWYIASSREDTALVSLA
eukprot:16275942-Heterocapsa_arctica.AAC.1